MRTVLTRREQLILYATLFVIGFSILFSLVILPLLNRDEALSKQIDVAQAKFTKYAALLSQKDAIQNAYNKFSQTFKVSGQEENTALSVLTELENLAKSAKINIIDIKPQTQKNIAAYYKEVLIDLKTEGTMEGYLKFIYNIENSLALLKIKKFQLNSKTNSPTLEGSFLISQSALPE